MESQVIDQLTQYNRICGRIKVLERYPIGGGMYLTESHDNNDRLQPLHKQLKQIPSHMYLNGREQKLERLAHAYLSDHPTGTKSQLHAIAQMAVADEDRGLAQELYKRIKKVVEVRGGDEVEGMLERLSELQTLQDQKEMIDHVLETMSTYKPQYTQLLRLRYIENHSVDETSVKLNISTRTYDNWRKKAIQEYATLAGI